MRGSSFLPRTSSVLAFLQSSPEYKKGVQMEYLSRKIAQSPIVFCEATFVNREEVEALDALPSSSSLVKACRRFRALRVHGGALLTTTIMHIESSRNQVLAHLKFSYDEQRSERLKAKEKLPYLDEEIAEFPCLDFGYPNSPPVVLEELVTLSKTLALPDNKQNVDRELLSDMLHEAALLMAKTTCQGSA